MKYLQELQGEGVGKVRFCGQIISRKNAITKLRGFFTEESPVLAAKHCESKKGNMFLQGFSIPFSHRHLLLDRASDEHVLENAVLNQRNNVTIGVLDAFNGFRRGILGR